LEIFETFGKTMAKPSEIVVLHSSDELAAVLKFNPQLRDTHFYFLTPSVSEEWVRSQGVSFSYFDELLPDSEMQSAFRNSARIADEWYRDTDGTDASELDGCSFGASMYYFVNHLFCQTFKYQAFFRIVLPDVQTLILTETADPLLSIAIKTVLKELPENHLKLVRVSSQDTQNLIPSFTTVNKSREAYEHFYPKLSAGNIGRWIAARAHQMTLATERRPRVVLVTAGKSSSMVRYLATHKLKAQFVLQLNSETLRSFLNNAYFFLYPVRHGNKGQIEKLTHRLLQMQDETSRDLLARYILPHFQGAIAYYRSALRQLSVLRPKLVILSADRHETHLLIAFAAKKLGIKTATMPHGYPMSVLPSEFYARGKRQIYNAALVLSDSYRKEYKEAGYEPGQIFVTSLHHFTQLPRGAQRKLQFPYRSALILTPDFTDSTRMNYVKRAIKDMMDCCLDLGTIELAIKARLESELKNFNIRQGKISHRGRDIAAYSGYGELRKYAEKFEIIVGGFSSATLESLIQGFKYFVYLPSDSGIGMWDQSALNEILYVARTTEELKSNIENNRIFKPEKTIDDLALVTPFKNEEDFFRNFENTILKCAEEIT
jgi:hypothetical protein